MIKTYQSIKFIEYHLQLNVEGRNVNIDFVGGATYPRKTNGIYTTDNKTIQKCLEESNDYNKNFRLLYKNGKRVVDDDPVSTRESLLNTLREENQSLKNRIEELLEGSGSDEELTNAYKEIETLKAKVKNLGSDLEIHKKRIEELEATETKEEEQKTTVADNVLNMQQARDFLVENFDVQVSKLPNGAAVKNMAKGLNVEFPNWK